MNKKDIAVFYHVFCADGWEKMFKEQLYVLVDSGLVEAAHLLHIVIVGNEYDYSVARTICPTGNKFVLIHEPHNEFEYSTLKYVRKYAAINDAYLLYMHTKGVSCLEVHRENSKAWRKYMEYFTIEKWQDCITVLNDGFDCCGCNWHACPDGTYPGHFSGNFWWANTGYLRKIQQLLRPVQFAFNSFDRRYYEFWINSAKPKYACLHENPKAFYTTKIEENEYRN